MSKSRRRQTGRSGHDSDDDDSCDPLKNIVQQYGANDHASSISKASQNLKSGAKYQSQSKPDDSSQTTQDSAKLTRNSVQPKPQKPIQKKKGKGRKHQDNDDDGFFLRSESEHSDNDAPEAKQSPENPKKSVYGDNFWGDDDVEEATIDPVVTEVDGETQSADNSEPQTGIENSVQDDPQQALLWKLARLQLEQNQSNSAEGDKHE